MNTIYIGFDKKEEQMAEMCKKSILDNTIKPVNVEFISKHDFKSNEYWRDDKLEGASTDFTFARFLSLYKNKFRDWVLFCDCDILFLEDINKLFDKYNDESKALYCVKHPEYISKVEIKMSGQKQLRSVQRKNWASVILFNSHHKDNQILMPRYINEIGPADLFQFKWTKDSRIGEMNWRWNYLAGEDLYQLGQNELPYAIHYTLFHPELAVSPNDNNNINCEFADIWYAEYERVFGHEHKYYHRYLELNKQIEFAEPAQNDIVELSATMQSLSKWKR